MIVSRMLPARQLFDMVIFDEASQVEPQDAVPSIMRAASLSWRRPEAASTDAVLPSRPGRALDPR